MGPRVTAGPTRDGALVSGRLRGMAGPPSASAAVLAFDVLFPVAFILFQCLVASELSIDFYYQAHSGETIKASPLVLREVPGRPAFQLRAAPHADLPGAPRGLPRPRAAEAGRGGPGPHSATLQPGRPPGHRAARRGAAPVPVSVPLGPERWGRVLRRSLRARHPGAPHPCGPAHPGLRFWLDPGPPPGCRRPQRTCTLRCPPSSSSGCWPT